jgi:hypothetical protein
MGDPRLSLEYLVSNLVVFEAGIPHDIIYALLAIARDATPRTVTQRVEDFAVAGRKQLGSWGTSIVSKAYYVD